MATAIQDETTEVKLPLRMRSRWSFGNENGMVEHRGASKMRNNWYLLAWCIVLMACTTALGDPLVQVAGVTVDDAVVPFLPDRTEPRIYPGAAIQTDLGRCTLSWILYDGDTAYALTAGHCVSGIGSPIRLLKYATETWFEIGTIVALACGGEACPHTTPDGTLQDAALIRIHDHVGHYVNPSLGHWTGPVALFQGTPRISDDLCLDGASTTYEHFEPTRPRCNTYVPSHDPHIAGFGMHAKGDSGSPVIHYRTGAAFGMLVGSYGPLSGSVPVGLAYVIEMDQILPSFEDQGYDLELATADYDPPCLLAQTSIVPACKTGVVEIR